MYIHPTYRTGAKMQKPDVLDFEQEVAEATEKLFSVLS
jgi:hypothetical protein